MKALAVLVAALAASIALAARAQEYPAPGKVEVIYKVIAPNGKVTYSQDEPKNPVGRVVKIELDPRANLAVFPKWNEKPAFLKPRPLTPQETARLDAENMKVQAEDALEAAKKALKDGQEPAEDELQWLGKKGGGARPVPTQAYHDRIKGLEDAVKRAEEAYEKARKHARMVSID